MARTEEIPSILKINYIGSASVNIPELVYGGKIAEKSLLKTANTRTSKRQRKKQLNIDLKALKITMKQIKHNLAKIEESIENLIHITNNKR